MVNDSNADRKDASATAKVLRYLDQQLETKAIEVYRNNSGTAYVITYKTAGNKVETSDADALPDP